MAVIFLWIFVKSSIKRKSWKIAVNSGKAQYFGDINEGQINFPLMKLSVGQYGFLYNGGAVLYDDIFWVYKAIQTYSVYFIPVFKQRRLRVETKIGRSYVIRIKGGQKWEKEVTDFMQFLLSKNGSIRVGSTPENQQAYYEFIRNNKKK